MENRSNDERFDEASSPTARSHKRRRRRTVQRRFVSDEARTLKKSRRPARHAVFPLFLHLRSSLTKPTLFLFSLYSSVFLWLTCTTRPAPHPYPSSYRLLSFIRFVQSSPILRIASRPLAVRLPCPPKHRGT